jgi:transcriptional regulator with XRE-family HTH domain
MLVNRIRNAMKEESITQLELEKLTGIDQGTLSKIINNKNRITPINSKTDC